MIPTGELRAVAGTPFDLRAPTALGAPIDVDSGGEPGIDHCYVIDRDADGAPAGGAPAAGRARARRRRARAARARRDARVPERARGNARAVDAARRAGVHSKLAREGRRRARAPQHRAVCLETKNFPDCAHARPGASAVLREGERYEHLTVHDFRLLGE